MSPLVNLVFYHFKPYFKLENIYKGTLTYVYDRANSYITVLYNCIYIDVCVSKKKHNWNWLSSNWNNFKLNIFNLYLFCYDFFKMFLQTRLFIYFLIYPVVLCLELCACTYIWLWVCLTDYKKGGKRATYKPVRSGIRAA